MAVYMKQMTAWLHMYPSFCAKRRRIQAGILLNYITYSEINHMNNRELSKSVYKSNTGYIVVNYTNYYKSYRVIPRD